MTYRITLKGMAGQGYRASCPQLPGCRVFAESRQAAMTKIQDAVAGYLASLDVALPRELRRLYLHEAVESAV